MTREALLAPMKEKIRLLPKLFSTHALKAFGDQNPLQKASEEGQIQGLRQLLIERKVPDSFLPRHWEVFSIAPLILGDACVWAITDSGKIGFPLSSDDPWCTIYLPISSSQLLVASRDANDLKLDVERLNIASAEVSWSYIYCSAVNEDFRKLASVIGRRNPLLGEQELAELVSQNDRHVSDEIIKRLREKNGS